MTRARSEIGEGTVRVERDGRLLRWTLDRPPLNILDFQLIDALGAAVAEAEADEGIQLIVLCGAGKAFSAGVDIAIHTREQIPRMLESFHAVLRSLHALDAVTLAAIDGHCLGGGMELAAVCDLAVASASSRFGQPEIRVGCYPPVAAALYSERLGSARTFDLLLSGRTMDAAEAERLGFLSRVLPDENFDAALDGVVEEFLAQSAVVARLTKRAIRAGAQALAHGEGGVDAALAATERIYVEELATTEDVVEGVDAFLEKRSPRWRHR